MSSKPNSPMSTKPSSPIPMELNSPIMTPPRSTTPSDLFWQIQMIQTKRMMGPIFDDLILPSYWSTERKKALAIHIEDAIRIKEMLTMTIRDIKYYLLTSTAPSADQLALITSLIKMTEKFEETKLLINHFVKYLSYEKQQVIKVLTTSEQLVKSAKELLNLPAVLALSLQQMTTDDSQPSGSC